MPFTNINTLVLRLVTEGSPEDSHRANISSTSDSKSTSDDSSTSAYTFVGDCYLHGVMNGECFGFKRHDGQMQWRDGVKLEDIKIV
jgi:hypothetical protein